MITREDIQKFLLETLVKYHCTKSDIDFEKDSLDSLGLDDVDVNELRLQIGSEYDVDLGEIWKMFDDPLKKIVDIIYENRVILVVPDVHGRDFWINPCTEWKGNIVFLGDYHDPYTFQVSVKKSLKNLQILVEFYEANKDRCTMLLGNHDGNYLIYRGFADRCDGWNYNKVKGMLQKLDLKICHKVRECLFSHSGILSEWLKAHDLTVDDVFLLDFNDKALCDVSPMRGGRSKCGGPLWGDVWEFDSYAADEMIPEGYYQIFGHSQQALDPIITEEYACLDCRKCFLVDCKTKEIKEYVSLEKNL